jgi:uncharacterized protein YjbI with pentapeptide repeats
MSSVVPCRAPVRPRVISPITGESVLLEETIAELLQTERPCFVAISGPRSSGKTTALQHLAALFPVNRLQLLDDGSVHPKVWCGRHQVLVRITQEKCSPDVALTMASWTDDEVLEYLLAVSPARTASVMGRWRQSTDHDLAEGSPHVIRWVLDQMIADDGIQSVRAGIFELLEQFLTDEDQLRRAGMFALSTTLGMEQAAFELYLRLRADLSPEFVQLLMSDGVRVVLAASHVLKTLPSRESVLHPTFPLPEELIEECGYQLPDNLAAESALQEIVGSESSGGQAMAASILHAASRPIPMEVKSHRNLRSAILRGIQWDKTDLQKSDLSQACFASANLELANLDQAILRSTDLSNANLSRASLRKVLGMLANLERADLTAADLTDAELVSARLAGTILRYARMQRIILEHADLRGADLSHADLSNAKCEGANIEEADFRFANLRRSRLKGLCLRKAQLQGANFYQANLINCDLEGVQLDTPNFESAFLTGTLLTGSSLKSPNFQAASLQNAGLAEIDWPNADLRDANLRGASFHLGSTRCGLVDSPYPSHGTRTGFYTNEYDEQIYRAPEDIRKANLQGADLRGAKVQGVDFYLVDLRGAKYTPDQLQHFIQCDAILYDRTTS